MVSGPNCQALQPYICYGQQLVEAVYVLSVTSDNLCTHHRDGSPGELQGVFLIRRIRPRIHGKNDDCWIYSSLPPGI